jgi:uncharacterized protein YlxW (UPF0749 family)
MRMAERQVQQRRPDASMSLLNDLFTRTLDPGYQEAAERRKAQGVESSSADPRLRFSASMVFGMVALGLLLTIAAVHVRESAPVITSERESLIERVHSQDEYVNGLSANLSALEGEVNDLQSDLLQNSAVGQAIQTDLTRAESIAGNLPVIGPGVVVTLRNPETLTGVAGERVLAIDLERVVNGLWAAGAEAVAINGQRITPQTSIQGVELVPQVNQQPLTPPYEVRAIGDGDRLATRFSEGAGGTWLRSMTAAGPSYDIDGAGQLELPAASTTLDIAEPLEVS